MSGKDIFIIDRRKGPKGKHFINRQRFIKRYQKHIKKYVERSINEKNLKDIGKETIVSIPENDIEELSIEYDRQTGKKDIVIPGNPGYSVGDEIHKPKGGKGGNKGNEASAEGIDEDAFVFVLNRDEFFDILFEDLELPEMIKKSLKETENYSYQRSGYTNTGCPANLSIVETYKRSLSRRISLKRPTDQEIEELEKTLQECKDEEERQKLILLLEELRKKQKSIPFFDDIDLRYRNYELKRTPSTKAVMFCIMDVSASMDEIKKNYGKKFFLLLYTFLQKKYTKVDVVFIRHHVTAEEVNEEMFFTKRETGGTVVSSALELIRKIINERYSTEEYNIFCAQVSDGDNFEQDNHKVVDILTNDILPRVQYYAYVQINPVSEHTIWTYYRSNNNDLLKILEKLSREYPKLQTKMIAKKEDIWKVFKELFSRK